MGNLWLKIKIWTKGILFSVIALYGLIFFLKNDVSVTVWYFPWKPSYSISLIYLMLSAFAAGAIVLLLIRTTFKTIGQVREMRQRNRIARIEREHTALKAKAAMLQTRTSSASSSSNTPPPSTVPPPPPAAPADPSVMSDE